jgi:hypothetical protein
MVSARGWCLALLMLLALYAVAVFAQRDFYEVLGVPKRSTIAQIKKAYRCVMDCAAPTDSALRRALVLCALCGLPRRRILIASLS